MTGRLQTLRPDFLAMHPQEQLEFLRGIRADANIRKQMPGERRKAATKEAKAKTELKQSLAGMSRADLQRLINEVEAKA